MLHEVGVAKVFTPGATTTEITGWVAEHFAEESTAG
jgi:methylmalonyl-CoA mutase C-terminal domain/subunit